MTNVPDFFSDLHKDAYGFRPSSYQWEAWKAMSADEIHAENLRMLDALDHSMREDERRHQESIAAFEAFIAGMKQRGISRADAIRYDMEAHLCNGDVGFYEFHWGVPYGYIEKGSTI